MLGTAAEEMYPAAVVAAFRERLTDDCKQAFDALVQAGCKSARLVDYLGSLTVAHDHHKSLQSDSPRMSRDKLRSLVQRTRRVSKDWDRVFHSHFGQELLRLAPRSDPSGTEAEFRNIPQRLCSLGQWAKDIHKGTSHRRRPLFDDNLAELLVYVERATSRPHLNEVSILVGQVTEKQFYSYNDLGVWKTEHKPALERAALRLQRKS